MSDLAELVVKVKADASSLEREMKKAESTVSSSSSKMSNSVSGLASQLRGLAPAISVVAFASFAKGAFMAADRLNDLAQRTGVAASTLSALNIPLLQGGASVEEFAASITRMNNVIGEAAKGNNQQLIDTFNSLGLSIEKLYQLSPEEQFYAIAQALNGVTNQADFTNRGIDIFGRSFATLAPLIKQTGGDLRGFVDDAKAAGDALTEEQLKKIDDFGDKWTEASEKAKLAVLQLQPVLDGLISSLDWINKNRPLESLGVAGIQAGAKLGLINQDVANAAAEEAAARKSGVGAVDFSSPTNKITVNPISATGKNPPAKKSGGSSSTALADYRRSLERQTALSGLDERGQVGLEAKFKTQDAAKAQGVKATEAMITANQNLALQAYDTQKALQDQTKAQEDARRATERFNDVLKDKLSAGLTDAVFSANNAGDAFRNMAMSIAKSIFEQSVAQPLSNSIVNGVGSLFGSGGGGGIGSFFGDMLPSFDVGSYNLPSDMIAKVHKGEMIIPAKEAQQIRSNGMGGGITVVQNNNFQSGVSRGELEAALPRVAAAAHDAVFASIQKGGSAAKIVGAR